jgi:hypothetical protein
MSTRKKANPKESSTSIPNSLKDREERSEHEQLVALSRRYYAKNELPSRLEALMIAVTETEWVKSEWLESRQNSTQDEVVFEEGTELSYELIEWALGAEWERLAWMPESYMLRRVARLIATGDTKGLQEFAAAQASYEEGLNELRYKDKARLFLMVACERLRYRGRTREEVLKAELRDLACELWAKYKLNRSGKPHAAENVQYAVKRLPKVDWPLIFKEVGLSDLAEAKRGWKKRVMRKGSNVRERARFVNMARELEKVLWNRQALANGLGKLKGHGRVGKTRRETEAGSSTHLGLPRKI